jgi:hypothetical protein
LPTVRRQVQSIGMRPRIIILLVAIVASSVIILGGAAVCLMSLRSPLPGIEVKAGNFRTDKERIAFIQRFLPVTIPDSASAIELRYTEWLGYDLEASFKLGSAELKSFINAMDSQAASRKLVACTQTTTASAPAVTTMPGGFYHFVTCDGYDTGTITIDINTGTVRLKCLPY